MFAGDGGSPAARPFALGQIGRRVLGGAGRAAAAPAGPCRLLARHRAREEPRTFYGLLRGPARRQIPTSTGPCRDSSSISPPNPSPRSTRALVRRPRGRAARACFAVAVGQRRNAPPRKAAGAGAKRQPGAAAVAGGARRPRRPARPVPGARGHARRDRRARSRPRALSGAALDAARRLHHRPRAALFGHDAAGIACSRRSVASPASGAQGLMQLMPTTARPWRRARACCRAHDSETERRAGQSRA